jgi:hypothetical protein
LTDVEVNVLVEQLLGEYPTLERNQPAFYQNLNSQTRSYLFSSHSKMQEMKKIDVYKNGRKISDNIRPILADLEEGSDPLEVLAKKMAPNYFEALDMDQKS